MPIPQSLQGRFRVPAIAAPMFLVSGPELVIAACQAGVAGTFPALNARPAAQLDEWLGEIDRALAAWQAAHPGQACAPHGVNLILHPSNERLAEDLATVVRHRVPLVITSLGHPGEVVKAVHGYGGLVFSDIIHASVSECKFLTGLIYYYPKRPDFAALLCLGGNPLAELGQDILQPPASLMPP